ncbi:MAG: hypothetical protein P1V51_20130 [Deltaproteobacteria bacterium]|nr:hypothetical protein [Deltaproteobacteria bacterium]
MFTLNADGMDLATDLVVHFPGQARENIVQALDFIGATMRAAIVEEPNKFFTDRTGLLRKSVQFEVDPGKLEMVLWPGQDYGKFVELGNGGKHAFLWPTLETHEALARSTIEAAIDLTIEQVLP